MNTALRLVAVARATAFAAVAALIVGPRCPWSHRQGAPPNPPAAAAEDSASHAAFQTLRLRNPITGNVPRDIAGRELAFVQAMTARATPAHPPLARTWAHRGPFNVGGRTRALALDVRDERVILAGSTSGGMWKSTDGGRSWRKTTQPHQLHSVSCIAQNTSPGREHIWYYGTGEGVEVRGSSAAGPLGTNAFDRGDGIFKSTDGGENWTQLPSTVSASPTREDPFDFVFSLVTFGHDNVLAATSGGVFLSRDGGATWDEVLSVGGVRRVTEVAGAPDGTLFATVGGPRPHGGIFRSRDGRVWEDMTPPMWPQSTVRTVIGVAPSNLDRVYFFTLEKDITTHLYRYDALSGWTDLRANLPWGGDMATYGGNMMVLKVKPDDDKTLFVGAIGLIRSTDGGQTFELIGAYSAFHVDQHALVFYPSNPKRMIVGNDGGLFRTDDNTAPPRLDPTSGERHIDWESLNSGYLTTQFYTVAVDHDTAGSQLIAGGMQDNGCMFVADADADAPWRELAIGDGGYVAVGDGGRYFTTSVAATLQVARHWEENGRMVMTELTPIGARMGLWLAPFLLDPHDTRIMYLPAGRDLWRNTDITAVPYVFPPRPTDLNWTRFEHVDDLITALAMSDAPPRRLYYGTFDGALARVDDPHQGQPVPVKLPLDTLPLANRYAYVGCIAVDPHNPDQLLVAYPNYEVLSIFLSQDGGQTWQPVAGNLEEHPDGSGAGPSVRWLAILYVQDQPVVFAATSVGLFSAVRLDGMNTVWVQEGATTIGCVVVDMVDVRQADGFVAVGTHGNGVYTTTITRLLPTVRSRVPSR